MATVKILLVEDDYLIRLTLAEALAEAGFAVLEAASGDEASAMLQHEITIALLLTDVQLPGHLNGLQLAELARNRTPDLPVLFMTGRPDVLGAGGRSVRDAFIAKPYLPSDVCAAARRLTGT
jgi:DNA-binding response OmpR family regulator